MSSSTPSKPLYPRKTRLIATVGPKSESPEALRELAEAGVNVFRLNFSHARHDWAARVVQNIRALEKELDRPIAISMDTQGPSIRTGDLPVPLALNPGEVFTFTVRGEKGEENSSVDVNYEEMVEDISVGDIVLVDNGVIRMKVLEKQHNKIRCEILTQGTLGSRRHINLPGVKVSLPSITDKDYEDVKWGIENGIDYVALSFVRTREDIEQLRGFLRAHKSPIKIIAKIEDQQAVENVETILTSADAIMVARGDLGIELPFEELPTIQRKIVKSCIRLGKPVIIATHLLESMHQNPMPTRAEVTDVANGVFEQADALMLSGETSVGRYPVKCIETLDIICRRIERSGGANFAEHAELQTDRQKIVASAVMLANNVKASGLVVFTHAGNTPQMASWLRPRTSHIYAFTPNETVWRQMCLLWGVRTFRMDLDSDNPEVTIQNAIQILKKGGFVSPGETLVFCTQVQGNGESHDSIQPRQVS
jgi:pyruvate kinase